MEKQITSIKSLTPLFPAVILAAGRGNRLWDYNEGLPKPLTRLLGLTLLDRAILSCQQAGINEFYVVVGYKKEEIISHLKKQPFYNSISIEIIENRNWEEGNGTSVLSVSPYLDKPFLLVMCDHIFEPEILRSLVKRSEGRDICLLAVDREMKRVFDLEDATKVRLKGNEITAIGKKVSPFDGIDMGLFFCQPSLFNALERSRRSGDSSLSGGIRYLIDEGKIQALEVRGHYWVDIDTSESLAYAKNILLKSLSKPEEDGFISHYLNRRLSRKISKRLACTSLTPNIITIMSFLICICSAFIFSIGGYLWTILAGILTQIGSIVDGCDGEISRLKFQSSSFGAWFDTVLDRYSDVALVTGITYGYWRRNPGALPWLGGFLALTGFIIYSYTRKEYSLRYGYKLSLLTPHKLVTRDMRLFVFFAGALLNRVFEAMVLIGIFSHLVIAWTFLIEYNRQGKLEKKSPKKL